MGRVVYADLLFLVDFSMDFLCFFITARLLHRRFFFVRSILAAAIGGVYSVLALLVRFAAPLGFLLSLGVCVLMCLCAFGVGKVGKAREKGEDGEKASSFFFHTAVYFGVSAGMGGLMTAFCNLLNRLSLPLDSIPATPSSGGLSVWLFGLLAVVSGGFAMAGGHFFRNTNGNETVSLEIVYQNTTLTLHGMVDSGNLASDPMSGRPVIFVDQEPLSRILPKEQIRAAMEGEFAVFATDSGGRGKIRLIPLQTATGEKMICAFVPDRVRIQKETPKPKRKSSGYHVVDALVAPISLSFSADPKACGCRALVPPTIVLR